MGDGFFWLKPRNLYGISLALKQAETFPEREQLRRLMLRGMVEWTFITAFCCALVLGFLFFEDKAAFIVASLAG